MLWRAGRVDNSRKNIYSYPPPSPNYWTPLKIVDEQGDDAGEVDDGTKTEQQSILRQRELPTSCEQTLPKHRVHWKDELKQRRQKKKIIAKQERRHAAIKRHQEEATMAKMRLKKLYAEAAEMGMDLAPEASGDGGDGRVRERTSEANSPSARALKLKSTTSAASAHNMCEASDNRGTAAIEQPKAAGAEQSLGDSNQSRSSYKLRLHQLLRSMMLKRLPTAVLDSGATGNFFRRKDGALPTGKPSSRVVGVPNGEAIRGEEEALLPMTQLQSGAREGDILQGLAHNSLVGVPKLAANGYTTIFYPDGKGVEVYDEQDVVIEAKNAPKLRG
jgi:hypothetical protein